MTSLCVEGVFSSWGSEKRSEIQFFLLPSANIDSGKHQTDSFLQEFSEIEEDVSILVKHLLCLEINIPGF